MMMALRTIETHSITLKNLALVRPKVCNSLSTNQIARFVNYYCYGVNVIELSIRLKNGKHSHGIEIRDSITIDDDAKDGGEEIFTKMHCVL